jgi:hypothetical protein
MSVHTVHLAKIADGPFCVDVIDAQHAHDEILAALHRGEKVVVSFAEVERLTTAFLNSALGQLYNEVSEEEITKQVSFAEANSVQLELIKRVMGRAREFFRSQR